MRISRTSEPNRDDRFFRTRLTGRPVHRATAPLVAAALAATLSGCGGAEEAIEQSSGQAEAPAAESQQQTTDPAPSSSPLAGTSWRLVEIQSMDDAQGVTRPENPSAFTMTLASDGTVTMQLDCNRATGTWTAEPSSDPTNGSFEFGTPMAVTQAMCPPPNLGDQIAAQAQYIRGYMIRDGRLGLSLMADGGIWLWEPLDGGSGGVAMSTDPDPALEEAIRAATAANVGGDLGDSRYVHSRIDLNGDGAEEVFAYLIGPLFCGTGGCNILLFTPGENAYELVDELALGDVPIYVSDTSTNGWRDIIRRQSGGGMPASWVHETWDGSEYVESERLPGDARPEGTQIMVGQPDFATAIPLGG